MRTYRRTNKSHDSHAHGHRPRTRSHSLCAPKQQQGGPASAAWRPGGHNACRRRRMGHTHIMHVSADRAEGGAPRPLEVGRSQGSGVRPPGWENTAKRAGGGRRRGEASSLRRERQQQGDGKTWNWVANGRRETVCWVHRRAGCSPPARPYASSSSYAARRASVHPRPRQAHRCFPAWQQLAPLRPPSQPTPHHTQCSPPSRPPSPPPRYPCPHLVTEGRCCCRQPAVPLPLHPPSPGPCPSAAAAAAARAHVVHGACAARALRPARLPAGAASPAA